MNNPLNTPVYFVKYDEGWRECSEELYNDLHDDDRWKLFKELDVDLNANQLLCLILKKLGLPDYMEQVETVHELSFSLFGQIRSKIDKLNRQVEEFKELVTLIKVLRAYTWSSQMSKDPNRKHPLYPGKQNSRLNPVQKCRLLWAGIDVLIKNEVVDP